MMSLLLDDRFGPLSPVNRHKTDFSPVTEQPGLALTREGVAMLSTRYSFAAEFCTGKDVLEVACGAGMGLGLLAKRASRLVAADFSEPLLHRARGYYGDRIAFSRLDAHSLPFAAGAFDVILLFEAIYYLRAPRQFALECRRVLRPGGTLLISAANPACPGFNPSPLSHRYFCPEELRSLLRESNFAPHIRGAFPLSMDTVRDKAVAAIRSTAVRLHLFPRSMEGKKLLKRMFYGRLVRIQEEIQEDSISSAPLHTVLPGEDQARYKVLYAIGRC